MTQRTLLLTGFEPWAEHTSNPSQEFLETAPLFSGWAVSSCLLPVDDSCFALFQIKVRDVAPDFIVSLGLAADRDEISIERCATRSPNALPGPDRLFSMCVLDDVRQSDDAGSFYCNDIFYLGLRLARNAEIRVAFVHLPPNARPAEVYDVVRRLLHIFA